MEFFKKTSNIDFMGLRFATAIFSLFIFAASIFSLAYYGLHLGLDFTGGTQIEVHYAKTAPLNELREKLMQQGFEQAVVQSYGSSLDVIISLPPDKQKYEKSMNDRIQPVLLGGKIQRIDFVGPQVGKELTYLGIIGVIISMIATMIYIMIRFEYRLAVSSTLALIHDPILILGVFSFFQLEFNLIALGAVLAIIGYSLNDTVVVFDRVRENFRKVRKATPIEIMNLSINQTLSRTTMTSGLTLMVVLVLFFFAGETLKSFSVALIVGIVIGTYSSIYVAGSLAVAMGLNRQDLLPVVKKPIDDLP